MMLRRSLILLGMAILVGTGPVLAQQKPPRKPTVKPNLHGWLNLPIPVGVPLFNDVTRSVGQLDLHFQYPVMKNGLGLGVGAKGSLFNMKENALAPANIAGDATRWTYYGQVQYEHYTGPVTYYQFSGLLGASKYTWDVATCEETTKQQGFFWGVNASYFVHASDNLAFGLILGYEHDASRMTPSTFCMESYPGISDTGPSEPYQFITVGLGFSTRFTKSPEGPSW